MDEREDRQLTRICPAMSMYRTGAITSITPLILWAGWGWRASNIFRSERRPGSRFIFGEMPAENGVYPLFFGYFGDGSVDFLFFTLS